MADNIQCFELADSRKQHFRRGLTDDPEAVASILRWLTSSLVGTPTGTESTRTSRKLVLVRYLLLNVVMRISYLSLAQKI
ncbi:MAG TPA: hypothetical protein DIU00_10450 [Phycisphaerales bacterium]|nr:hypothetical protein [Phycisphaerales bacterium]